MQRGAPQRACKARFEVPCSIWIRAATSGASGRQAPRPTDRPPPQPSQELKQELQSRGLGVDGKKDELVARLEAALAVEAAVDEDMEAADGAAADEALAAEVEEVAEAADDHKRSRITFAPSATAAPVKIAVVNKPVSSSGQPPPPPLPHSTCAACRPHTWLPPARRCALAQAQTAAARQAPTSFRRWCWCCRLQPRRLLSRRRPRR
jgi:hypothetical protein